MSNAKTICTVCNYIYDEALGEPTQNIPPSLKFNDLSDQWKCPECESGKEMFQPCSCVSLPIYEQTCVAHAAIGIANRAKADDVSLAMSKTCLLYTSSPQQLEAACSLALAKKTSLVKTLHDTGILEDWQLGCVLKCKESIDTGLFEEEQAIIALLYALEQKLSFEETIFLFGWTLPLDIAS